jgi:hypothetical protein
VAHYARRLEISHAHGHCLHAPALYSPGVGCLQDFRWGLWPMQTSSSSAPLPSCRALAMIAHCQGLLCCAMGLHSACRRTTHATRSEGSLGSGAPLSFEVRSAAGTGLGTPPSPKPLRRTAPPLAALASHHLATSATHRTSGRSTQRLRLGIDGASPPCTTPHLTYHNIRQLHGLCHCHVS